MVDYITNECDGVVAIYPGGEFKLHALDPDGEVQPFVFYTSQERAAFVAGIHHGADTAGGGVRMFDEDDDEEDEMDKLANFPGDRRKLN